jgi:Matrixin
MEVRSSFTVLFGLLLLSIVISSSPLVSIHTVDASTDSDFFEDFEEEDFEEEDFEEEDFEEENSIQICCTWGSSLEDGSLTYHIDDDDDMSEEQQQAVRNAVHEWDTKIEPLELEEESSKKISDITIELGDDNDGEELAGQTITISNGYGFLVNAQITIYKGVQEYEFDTATIGQVAKHEMGHALGLGHANFDGNLMAEMVNYGTATVSECEINAVIEANYWKLGGDGNSGPSITPSNSITC